MLINGIIKTQYTQVLFRHQRSDFMNISNIDNMTDLDKEFWDNLQAGIIKSNNQFTKEDIFSYVEKSFMFSLFFRGTSYKELSISRLM